MQLIKLKKYLLYVTIIVAGVLVLLLTVRSHYVLQVRSPFSVYQRVDRICSLTQSFGSLQDFASFVTTHRNLIPVLERLGNVCHNLRENGVLQSPGQ